MGWLLLLLVVRLQPFGRLSLHAWWIGCWTTVARPLPSCLVLSTWTAVGGYFSIPLPAELGNRGWRWPLRAGPTCQQWDI
jgi:hypothetical protein